MFVSNGKKKEAKKIFADLELRTNNIIELDTLTVALESLKANLLKDMLTSEYFPLPGGTLLKSISLVLDLIEFIENCFNYPIKTL